ncbi:MAG: hypothetical protein IPO05_11645 [Flavobacteriales bacterium]|nr:hypothetical protein [Flavobacteriales bacterium]
MSAGFDCTWSPPDGLSAATGNSVLALPAATTTYFARHIDTNGCAAVDSVIFNVTTIDTAVILTGTMLSAAHANASYQWINCDSALAIPGATAQTYTVSEVGSYAVGDRTQWLCGHQRVCIGHRHGHCRWTVRCGVPRGTQSDHRPHRGSWPRLGVLSH